MTIAIPSSSLLACALRSSASLLAEHQKTEAEKDQIEDIAAGQQRHRQIRHAPGAERDQAARKRDVETQVTAERRPEPTRHSVKLA